MSKLELKEQLINRIQTTNDQDVLEGILRLLEFESKDSKVYKLNDEQKNSILIAQEQVERGEFYTEEEADNLTDKWLSE